MPNWQVVFVALAALAAMRLGGLISSLWIAIGIAGFIAVLWLVQNMPIFRRWASALLIIWLLFSLGFPFLAARFQVEYPILAAALGRRIVLDELVTAEWADPAGLRARVGIARYCQQVDQMQGEWLAGRLEILRQSLEPPRPGIGWRILFSLGVARQVQPPLFPRPPRDAETALYNWLKVIERHREECRALVIRGVPKPSTPHPILGGWFGQFTPRHWFFLIATILVAAALLPMFGGWAARFGQALGSAAVIIALLATLHWLIWGGGVDKLRQFFPKPVPAVEAVTPTTPATSANRLVVDLKGPKEWVVIADRLPAKGVVDWNTRQAHDPWARFNDGKPPAPLRGNLKDRGSVEAVRGGGVVVASW